VCNHCWHDDHQVGETIPQTCCWCDAKTTRQSVRHNEHGPYVAPPVRFSVTRPEGWPECCDGYLGAR
jgi:hypothetical protein